jgi:hypothetical protein
MSEEEAAMTKEELAARRDLAALAADEQGRALLQLALRGIQESENGLTIGCWVKADGGVSGCLFQHAYWQGVAEGAFVADGAAKTEIKDFVPEEDFALVMRAIRALDTLGGSRFIRRRGLRRELDESAWRDAVEGLLVDSLAEAPVAEPPVLVAR